MKNAILALMVALGLAAAFVGYATKSMAGGCDGNYGDDRSESTQP